ncbi:MAG: hypothetical protein J6K39_02190 [Clostridia bacterium]|nr:hypothetical protein [Clostridia bacterium]
MLPVSTETVLAESKTSTYVVTANSANVYDAPSFSATKLSSLKNKAEVVLEMGGTSPKAYGDDLNFFKTEEGYIFAELLTPKSEVIVSIPNFNAKTKTACNVYFKEDNVITKSETVTLEKAKPIFLYEGFDSDADFNAIAFLYDNQVMYGYLVPSDINPGGLNPLIITCITLILACLGIIFAWVFMKNKKVKTNKRI